MRHADTQPNDVHQHSGWLIPLTLALMVVALSGIFLLYYLRPGPHDLVLTGDSSIVSVSVKDLNLAVPANYIRDRGMRAGGPQQVLTLVALLPDMSGYSTSDERLFATNAPDSPVLTIRLKNENQFLTPQESLTRIYAPYLLHADGAPGPFGLTRYGFQPASAYGRSELFAGQGPRGLVLLVCERAMPDLPSPNCLATDESPVVGVSLSYRFKRAYLSRWQQTVQRVGGLLRRFQAAS